MNLKENLADMHQMKDTGTQQQSWIWGYKQMMMMTGSSQSIDLERHFKGIYCGIIRPYLIE